MKRSTCVFLVVLGLVQGVRAQTGSPGCGLVFDGNSRIATATQPTLQNPSEFTFEAWLAPSVAGTATNDYILQKSGSYALRINSLGNYVFEATLDPGAQTFTVTSAAGVNYSTGIYHHVAVTFHSNSGFLRMFIDGAQVGVVPGLAGKTLAQTATNLQIGGQGGNPVQNGYTGKMDELRIWSIRRTISQLQADLLIPLRHAPNLELAIAGNGAQGATLPPSFLEGSDHHVMTMTGNVTIGAGMICATAHPGTGADFVHLTGLNGNTPNSIGNKPVIGGGSVAFEFRSPAGTFDGAAFFWPIQIFPSGFVPTQYPGFLDIQLDVGLPFILILDNVVFPASGFSFSTIAAPLTGVDLWSQGVVISPASATGYATTDAHVLLFPDPIYADPIAAGGGNGTPAMPFNTLGAALQAAVPGKTVILSTGTFNETVTVNGEINILGGYNPNTWAPTNTRTIIRPDQNGMAFRNIQLFTSISGLDIRSAAGLSASVAATDHDMTSIAVDIKNCSDSLQFTNCRFDAAGGANGPAGADAPSQNAASGANGSNGEGGLYAGSFPMSQRQGGNGAGNGGDGGDGGYGYCTNWLLGSCTLINRPPGDDGIDGNTSCGGNGGGGGSSFTVGVADDGGNGSTGTTGFQAAHGATNSPSGGTANASGKWVANVAAIGATGNQGCGGGGGGGGGCVGSASLGVNRGGGGGGGGAGGSGGGGGSGGTQGAPSVAAWLFDASPTFMSCLFLPGPGGNGGQGGDGQEGGNGGSGGNGGARDITANGSSGAGGDGGDGGRGGGGGGGGGAHGGASWCVVLIGTSAPPDLTAAASGNTFTPGTGGSGGSTGLQGHTSTSAPSGSTGATAITKNL